MTLVLLSNLVVKVIAASLGVNPVVPLSTLNCDRSLNNNNSSLKGIACFRTLTSVDVAAKSIESVSKLAATV